MPEDYDLDDEQDPEEQTGEKPSALRKAVESANERATTAEKENAELKKQLAVRDSGLDMSNPQHKFFADNYQGDMTPDAVKAKATELGFLAPPAPDVPDAEVAQHAASAAMAAGADAGGSGPDVDAAFKADVAALGRGGDPYKVAALVAQHYGSDAVYED